MGAGYGQASALLAVGLVMKSIALVLLLAACSVDQDPPDDAQEAKPDQASEAPPDATIEARGAQPDRCRIGQRAEGDTHWYPPIFPFPWHWHWPWGHHEKDPEPDHCKNWSSCYDWCSWKWRHCRAACSTLYPDPRYDVGFRNDCLNNCNGSFYDCNRDCDERFRDRL